MIAAVKALKKSIVRAIAFSELLSYGGRQQMWHMIRDYKLK